MEEEFLAFERAAQAGVQLQSLPRELVHPRQIETEAVAALLFGTMHRRIRVFKKPFWIVSVAGVDRDADVGRNVGFESAEIKWRRQCLDNLLRDQSGIVRCGQLREQEHELVVAKASDGIGVARVAPQALCGLDKQLVAGTAPVDAVHVLEVVKLDNHASDPTSRWLRLGEHLGQVVVEAVPIRQAGEGVEPGEVGEALLRTLALGDIAADTTVTPEFPVFEERHAAYTDEAHRSVLAGAAIFEVAERLPRGEYRAVFGPGA